MGRSGAFDVLLQRSLVWLCGFGPVLNPLAALDVRMKRTCNCQLGSGQEDAYALVASTGQVAALQALFSHVKISI